MRLTLSGCAKSLRSDDEDDMLAATAEFIEQNLEQGLLQAEAAVTGAIEAGEVISAGVQIQGQEALRQLGKSSAELVAATAPFSAQLQQLADEGFDNVEHNSRLLMRFEGDVGRVLQELHGEDPAALPVNTGASGAVGADANAASGRDDTGPDRRNLM